MKLAILALFTAAGAGALAAPATAGPSAPAPYDIVDGARVPVTSWAPRDTADTLWRRGRIAISEEDWSEAVQVFGRLQERYPTSKYAGDALYWQAFALQRLRSTGDLRLAVAALEKQKARYPKSATYESGESAALLTRLNGLLARGGDATAAAAISEMAMSAAQVGLEAAAAVMPVVAEEMRRVRPEIERGMAAAARDMARSARQMRNSDEIPAECEGVIGEEKLEALNALMQMNSEQAMPILKRVLERRDKCSEVLRRKAVFLVSQKRSEEAVDILLKTAKTDPDTETRKQAVFWLSQTRSERAVEVLEQILLKDSPDEEMQEQALFAISQIRSDRAQGILRDYVRRTDVPEKARADAIFWLGQRRDPESLAFLRELFPTLPSHELREKVLFSVSQQKSPENGRWLLQQAKDRRLDGELRKSALFWAGQSGVAVKDLAEIYDTAGNDRELRNQVIFVLSQRRNDTAAMDKLVEIAQREPDKELRQQAIFWLGQSRDPRAAKLLEDIINKP
ncbi:MAG: HEAT repeat domain-containing protein [Gemmatimonadaceae bacterium]